MLKKKKKELHGVFIKFQQGIFNNNNNSLMQINILKRFNLDKLGKINKLLFRKLKIILDGNNINMRN